MCFLCRSKVTWYFKLLLKTKFIKKRNNKYLQLFKEQFIITMITKYKHQDYFFDNNIAGKKLFNNISHIERSKMI